ncbi:MAG: DUF4386 family protein [Sphingomonas sp.]
MEQPKQASAARPIGIALIVYAIGFNIPYTWLGINFDYPAILRAPPGEILARFAAQGDAIVFAWAAFMAAALLLAPVAVGVARVTRRRGDMSQAIAAIGVAAAIAQAIGLSRWVYAVPGLAASWAQGDVAQAEAGFLLLHQFAGVGVGEAIGQTLTAFWLIGVALGQRGDQRYGAAVAWVGLAAGVVLLLGLVEGLATVLHFDPGLFGLAALVGFLLLTVWMIWTGILCIRGRGATA